MGFPFCRPRRPDCPPFYCQRPRTQRPSAVKYPGTHSVFWPCFFLTVPGTQRLPCQCPGTRTVPGWGIGTGGVRIGGPGENTVGSGIRGKRFFLGGAGKTGLPRGPDGGPVTPPKRGLTMPNKSTPAKKTISPPDCLFILQGRDPFIFFSRFFSYMSRSAWAINSSMVTTPPGTWRTMPWLTDKG
jgi:hypothetical protein